jgi:hypothetical protein
MAFHISSPPGSGGGAAAAAVRPAGAATDGGDALPVESVTAWVAQLARTLKTCRLYDGENPTVIKFREDASRELEQLLGESRALTLGFSSTDVLYAEQSVYAARTREDNLALPFFRDGIRSITFQPGIQHADVESFLDQVLRVTAPGAQDEDLVTLLWDANIGHVDVDYVPTVGGAEGEGSGGGAREGRPSGPIAPWPGSERRLAGEAAAPLPPVALDVGAWGRSDDWQTSQRAIDLEPAFARLEGAAWDERERFRAEFHAEHEASAAEAALTAVSFSLAAFPTREDTADIAQFLPRVLRETVRAAEWRTAREALSLLHACELPDWTVAGFVKELLASPATLTKPCVATLDQQPAGEIEAFLEFARELGPDAAEWLMTILAESQVKQVRRPLTRVVADHCRMHPERLRPWLANPQWYVVRNVVHILGWIGGANVVRLLREASTHEEPRVRQEVVAALGQADRNEARPILLRMIDTADGRLFGAVLHQLSTHRDPIVSRKLLECILDPGFSSRPSEEAHALFVALANCGGDEVIPALEGKLQEGGWFSRTPDTWRRAIARCLARIGTPAALEALRRGARSRRPALNKACDEALKGMRLEDSERESRVGD